MKSSSPLPARARIISPERISIPTDVPRRCGENENGNEKRDEAARYRAFVPFPEMTAGRATAKVIHAPHRNVMPRKIKLQDIATERVERERERLREKEKKRGRTRTTELGFV